MKEKRYFCSTPSNRSSIFYEIFKHVHMNNPIWVGVDWAKDSGMNRGDIIKTESNVIHVRFKTIGV